MVKLTQPGLVVFDMDSTLITIECIDEIAALAGKKAEVSAVTEAAMQGEIDFAASLQARVELLTGVEVAALEQLFTPIPLTSGAVDLIRWFQQRGWKTAVASGGFTWFADRLQARLGLDSVLANSLEISAGKLTGRVVPPIIDAASKAAEVRRLAQQFDLPMQQTIAVGDGANDIPMLECAGLGIAFAAKPLVQAHADLVIPTADLTLVIDALERRFG